MNNVLVEDFDSLLAKKIGLSAFKNKTVLVTGATGFIGSLLIKFLLYSSNKKSLNINIVAVARDKKKADKIFKGYIPNGGKLKYVIQDIREPIKTKIKTDYIFHAASVTTSKFMIEKPADTIEISVNGTANILNYAVRSGAKKIIYLSSMEVYGTVTADKKTAEKDLGYIDILNVRSSYPESKRLCENLCLAYAAQYKLNINIARLSGVFGAGILSTESRVFASFAKSALSGKEIVLLTRGLSEGNYCYSIEAVEALLLLALKGESSEVYNVVNEKNHTTIKEMAKLAAKEISGDSSRVIVNIPKKNQGFAADTKLKLSGAKLKKLGFAPKISLKKSYARLARYIQEEGML
jgi:nucleoside-diphosphate-sugar epimerase